MWRQFPTLPTGRSTLPDEPAAGTEGPREAGASRLDEVTAMGVAPERSPGPDGIPDLLGLPSTEARRLARLHGLQVEVVERGTDREDWGRVLEQSPAPGSSGATDEPLVLTVGSRPHVIVPELRGRDEDEALSMLREAGLGAARRATRRSDRVPEGCIVRTRPRAGAEVPAGSAVSYVVASGPKESGGRHGPRHRARPSRLPDGSFLSLPEDGRRERR
jgi:hypothetical protein